ncbi:MAG: 1-aminocyclopropane-1-carboxylate deaminase/D-cysteine desulfhydrase, partial [Chloroflexota bacterium]
MSTSLEAIRLSPAEIRERIARLPRVPLAFTPTPLEEVPRLSEALGGPRILIKRDDLTGFAFGGNKVRAMEFRLAHVKAHGYDAFVLVNIGQSNHARLHAAACARLGIKMVIVKPGPKGERVTGNLLLNHITGVEIVETGTTDSAELDKILDETLDDLRRRGYTPYASTREPFSPIAGTVAFTEASIELLGQLAALDATCSRVFLVGGTSAAGLALGGKLQGAPYRVHAVSVGGSKESLMKTELNLSNRVATEVLDLPSLMTADDFAVFDEYV